MSKIDPENLYEEREIIGWLEDQIPEKVKQEFFTEYRALSISLLSKFANEFPESPSKIPFEKNELELSDLNLEIKNLNTKYEKVFNKARKDLCDKYTKKVIHIPHFKKLLLRLADNASIASSLYFNTEFKDVNGLCWDFFRMIDTVIRLCEQSENCWREKYARLIMSKFNDDPVIGL